MKNQRQTDLERGIERLSAEPDPQQPGRWIYFAEETRSWWSVSEEAVVLMGDVDADYNTWAEQDDSAVECGKRRPR